MNLITRHTDYAVRALLYMAKHDGQLVSTADLDQDRKLPRPFMRKILQILQKEGYLSSVKGRKGGFRLERSLEKMRLIDLMRIFQGEVSLGDCLFRKKVCDCIRTCPLRKEVKSAEGVLLDRLRSITLAGLMRKA